MTNSSEYPLVTFALFAYNQEKYIQNAVEAALAQDYPNLEVIISDDCSTDGTWKVIQEIVGEYKGPHRIVLNRNDQNLGIGSHVSLVGGVASGDLVVLAAGDDISHPSRTRKLQLNWNESGRPTACVYSDVEPVTSSGELVEAWGESVYPGPHSLQSFAAGDIRILGASTAYTRDVFSEFPPISPCVSHEDRVLPMRALLLGGAVLFLSEALVKYRIEGGISRGLTKERKQYLQNLGKNELRSLKDSVQRLADALYSKAADRSLISRCINTVANHQAFIEISGADPCLYEFNLLRAIRRGAKAWPAVKLYLKLRFIGI